MYNYKSLRTTVDHLVGLTYGPATFFPIVANIWSKCLVWVDYGNSVYRPEGSKRNILLPKGTWPADERPRQLGFQRLRR
jgi:hypothetical protein